MRYRDEEEIQANFVAAFGCAIVLGVIAGVLMCLICVTL